MLIADNKATQDVLCHIWHILYVKYSSRDLFLLKDLRGLQNVNFLTIYIICSSQIHFYISHPKCSKLQSLLSFTWFLIYIYIFIFLLKKEIFIIKFLSKNISFSKKYGISSRLPRMPNKTSLKIAFM